MVAPFEGFSYWAIKHPQNIVASLILAQACLSHPSKPILKAGAMDYLPISPPENETE